MLLVYVPIWSMIPVIVTFGAGACAMAGTTIPKTATRATATTNSLLITASSKSVGAATNRCAPWDDIHNSYRDSGQRYELIREHREKRQEKTTLSRPLLTVPHRAQTLHRRLAEGRVRGQLPGPPEAPPGLLRPLPRRQDQAEVVVGRL